MELDLERTADIVEVGSRGVSGVGGTHLNLSARYGAWGKKSVGTCHERDLTQTNPQITWHRTEYISERYHQLASTLVLAPAVTNFGLHRLSRARSRP